MLRGIDGPLDRVGAEKDEVGIGRVVAGQQSFLGEPRAIIAAEDGLDRLTVGSICRLQHRSLETVASEKVSSYRLVATGARTL